MRSCLSCALALLCAGVWVDIGVAQAYPAVEAGSLTRESLVAESQPVLGRLFSWSGEAPLVTRRGAPLVDMPESGDGIQAYDLIETPEASELVLLLYHLTSPLSTPMRMELAANSAVFVLGNGHIVVLDGHVRVRDMPVTGEQRASEQLPSEQRAGLQLSYNRLDLSVGAGADIDIITTIEGTALVSARAGRAELRVPDTAVPVQRVFVSPGVGAFYDPDAGLRNIEIDPGADAEVAQLQSELADAAASTSTVLLHDSAREYEQYREQFLRAYEVVFRDHALIQDLRRIDMAHIDGVPLGFFAISPDGSGRSLRDVSGNETTAAHNGLGDAAATLLGAALELDRAMRRVTRFVDLYLGDTVLELKTSLNNREGHDRERLAAAYYAARLTLSPMPHLVSND
ncbi:MAG: hypothetical protein EA428_13280 [Spirochaetaceae bacterium]|nr:MAG: hypothetical protein EA428_13280 [Spirochaetaceae bacterium]